MKKILVLFVAFCVWKYICSIIKRVTSTEDGFTSRPTGDGDIMFVLMTNYFCESKSSIVRG
ncbi:MAG: hypothetical protein ACRC2T_02680 [Thermoguttaceae bacterium]